jgi:hypothetical protein
LILFVYFTIHNPDIEIMYKRHASGNRGYSPDGVGIKWCPKVLQDEGKKCDEEDISTSKPIQYSDDVRKLPPVSTLAANDPDLKKILPNVDSDDSKE